MDGGDGKACGAALVDRFPLTGHAVDGQRVRQSGQWLSAAFALLGSFTVCISDSVWQEAGRIDNVADCARE